MPTLRCRFQFLLLALGLLWLASLCLPNTAHADGIYIPAPSRSDAVVDFNNRIVYISAGPYILRYDLDGRSFLPALELGGRLSGIDLSPDGRTLAVADDSYTANQIWIYLVRLDTDAIQKVPIARTSQELGTYAVAYGADGKLLISTTAAGSYWVTLQRYDPVADMSAMLAVINPWTMLSASADRSVIAYAESNNSIGPWGRYRVATGNLWRCCGTEAFNYEIAINRDATQVVLPTYLGAYVYDAAGAKIATLNVALGGRPLGAAYSPIRDLLYTAWAATPEVRVFDTRGLAQVDAFNLGTSFDDYGNHAFGVGRLRVARDGGLLLANVTGGVRVLRTDPAGTRTVLQASATQPIVSVPFSMTATVTRQSGGAVTGPLTFYEQDAWGRLTSLGSAALRADGTAVISPTLPTGAHTVFASYEGTFDDHSSTSEPVSLTVVSAATTTTLELPTASMPFGTSIVVTATVSRLPAGTPGDMNGWVVLWEGTRRVDGMSLYPPSHSMRLYVDGLSLGTHCVYAQFLGDDRNLASVSPQACFEVIRAPAALTLTGSATRAGAGFNATILVSARAGPLSWVAPGGQVTLYGDQQLLGTLSLDSRGRAAFTVNDLADAAHTFRVEYGGSDSFLPSSGELQLGPLRRVYLGYLAATGAEGP